MGLNIPGNRSTRPWNPMIQLALVPSTDTNGHGTFLAGIAAGGFLPEEDFTGAAPECELLIVKLKPPNSISVTFYLVRSDADAYQENDIMMGIKYLRVEAYSRGNPWSSFSALAPIWAATREHPLSA